MSAYLDLLEKCLTGVIYRDPPLDPWAGVVRDDHGNIVKPNEPGSFKVSTISPGEYDSGRREVGCDWPATAHTMIGVQRLRQLREACVTVLGEHISGDFIETGVWRGGACILMQAVLRSWYGDASTYNEIPRRVFVADSFEGLPLPKAVQDAKDLHHLASTLLAVSEEQVRENFKTYGLLDGNVKFLRGWFEDTLPGPVTQLAVLRLDGDMYESTNTAIMRLYPLVNDGGFIIVDDYYAVKGCKQAVDDYRAFYSITTPLIEIDGVGVYWRKNG